MGGECIPRLGRFAARGRGLFNLQVLKRNADGTVRWADDETAAPGAGEANVQVDWNEGDTKSDAYIQHKPLDRLIPPGGATNQVLTKSGNGDYALTWAIPQAPSSSGLTAAEVLALISDWAEEGNSDRIGLPKMPRSVVDVASSLVAGYAPLGGIPDRGQLLPVPTTKALFK